MALDRYSCVESEVGVSSSPPKRIIILITHNSIIILRHLLGSYHVKTLQEWKQDVDGRDVLPPGPPLMPGGAPVTALTPVTALSPATALTPPTALTPSIALNQSEARAISSASIDNTASADKPATSVREVQLEKTCNSLQKQVGRLQESINSITNFITSGYISMNQSSAASSSSAPFATPGAPSREQLPGPLSSSSPTSKEQPGSLAAKAASKSASSPPPPPDKSSSGVSSLSSSSVERNTSQSNSNGSHAPTSPSQLGPLTGVGSPTHPWEGAMISQALNNLPEGLHPLDVQQLLISAAKWMTDQAGLAGATPIPGVGDASKTSSAGDKGASSGLQAGHFLPDDKDLDDGSEKPPTELEATARSDTSISLKWQPSSMPGDKGSAGRQLISPIKGYKLSIQLGDKQREVMDVPYPQAILGGLTPGTYRFSVRGVGPNSESTESNMVEVTLPPSPSSRKISQGDGQKTSTSPVKQRPVASPRSSKDSQQKKLNAAKASAESKDPQKKVASKKTAKVSDSKSDERAEPKQAATSVKGKNVKNDAKSAGILPEKRDSTIETKMDVSQEQSDSEPSVVDLEDGLKVAIAKSVGVEMSQSIIDTAIQMAIIALIDVGPDVEGASAVEEATKDAEKEGGIQVVPIDQLEEASPDQGPQAEGAASAAGHEEEGDAKDISAESIEKQSLPESEQGGKGGKTMGDSNNGKDLCNGVEVVRNKVNGDAVCNGDTGKNKKNVLDSSDAVGQEQEKKEEKIARTEAEGLDPKTLIGCVIESLADEGASKPSDGKMCNGTMEGGESHLHQSALKEQEATVFNFDFQGGVPCPQSPTGIEGMTNGDSSHLGVAAEQQAPPPVKSPKPKPSPRLSKLAANFSTKSPNTNSSNQTGSSKVEDEEDNHRVSIGHDPFSVDFEESLPVSDCDDNEDRMLPLRLASHKVGQNENVDGTEDSRTSSDDNSSGDQSSPSGRPSKQMVTFCLTSKNQKVGKSKHKENSTSRQVSPKVQDLSKQSSKSREGSDPERAEKMNKSSRPSNIKTILSPLGSPMMQQKSRTSGGSGIPMVRVPSPTKTGFLRIGGGVHRATSTPSLDILKSPGGSQASNGQNKGKPESPSTDSHQPHFTRCRSKSGGNTLSSPGGGGGGGAGAQNACKGRIKGKKGSKVPQMKRSGSEPNLYLQKQLEAEEELEMQSSVDSPMKQRRGSAGSQVSSNKHSRLMSPGSGKLPSPGSKLPIKHSTSTQNLSTINGSRTSSSAAAAKRAASPGPTSKRSSSPRRGTSPGPTKRGTSPGPAKHGSNSRRGTSPGPAASKRAISPGRVHRSKQATSPTGGAKSPTSTVSNANNSNSDECKGKLSKMAKMYRNLHNKELKSHEDNANNNNSNTDSEDSVSDSCTVDSGIDTSDGEFDAIASQRVLWSTSASQDVGSRRLERIPMNGYSA
ncbi:uncharacterized protein [Diadema antillarum]|uniref:uncharacterized protein n=1 Tax=Diadema antillarum TaxID=105358 RepID=UPI003A8B4D58